jgi:hypothetical protein
VVGSLFHAARRWRLVLVVVLMLAAATLALTSRSPSAASTPDPTYVRLSGVPGQVNAALYAPAEEESRGVGLVVMHRNSNFLSHISGRELQSRGYTVLTMNPRSINNEALVDHERNALDLKAGVQYLRSRPGIRKVLLLGHSGGGPASTFYQAVAEQGVGFCRSPRKLVKCPDELEGLPPVDGVVLVDAHSGIGVNALRSLNPAVRDEDDPRRGYDRRLDPFNPANGYRPDGASKYSETFKREYFKAQSQRMNRLIEEAQRRLRDVERGKSFLTDDAPFICYRCDAARLYQMDPSIHSSTEQPAKLIRNDGTISTQVLRSVHPPQPDLREDNATWADGTMQLTLRSFLSGRAVRSTDSMNGIDYCSSNNSTTCNVQNISVPLLVLGMGGHYFVGETAAYYRRAASADKDYAVVEGATHGMTPCTACETTPGQYSNATRNTFDYIAAWIGQR